MSLLRRSLAEFVGTFWLVFAGVGSAVIAASIAPGGIGMAGVAAAFGLALLTAAYAIGHISGCHINPAVSLGLCVAGRFPWRELFPYVLAQVAGALAAAALVYGIAVGQAGFDMADGLAANGYGENSPEGYSLLSGAIAEIALTFMFVLVILGATDARAPVGFAPIAIGLALTAVHLVGIPVTNMSVNPARSTGPALLMGGWALQQLWLFWVAPAGGAALAGMAWRFAFSEYRLPAPGVNREDINVARAE